MKPESDETVTSATMWTYPQQHNPCPPDTAKSVSAVYFRATEADRPTADDFIPWLAMKPKRWRPQDECKAAGLSLYSDLPDARRMVKTLPLLKGKKLVAISIGPADGVVQPTPSKTSDYHCTWWPAPRTDCLKLVVEIATES